MCYAVILVKVNYYLDIFPGSDEGENGEAELNTFMLHIMPTGWENLTFLQGFDFEMVMFKL